MIKLTKKQLLLSTLLSGTMMATSAVPSFAQDADDEVKDEIIVVGSNIPRAISDAPLPITTIDSFDIEVSGISSVSDLIRNTTYNTFGSFRERSGSSFGQVATVDIKGLGANYTAVLLNGRRVPGSALTGGSIVDINTIPLSAVESINVLKDSASAIYGADAISGVIDIRLKDDFVGFEVGANIERPSLPGADSESFSATWGTTTDRGNIILGYEHFEREAISDADRFYSRADTTGPVFDVNTTGVSVGGNTGFETDFSAAFPLGSCDTSIYAGVFDTPFGVPGQGCGFAYANISLQTGNLNRESVFLSSNYELNENAEFYLDGTFTNSKTSGRYAPAVGFFPFSAASPFNTLGRDILAFHRFVGHGNRDDSTDTDQVFLSTGITGEIGNGVNFDVFGRFFDYSGEQLGNTYVQRSVFVAEVNAGNYDVFNPLSQDPIHLGAVERSGIQLSRDLKSKDVMVGATFNGEGSFLSFPSGEKLGWAAGFEYGKQEYTDIYDEFREALDVLGSAGNSASGDRSRTGIFGEIRLPFTDQVEVNVAGRYDDFSGFGGNFSPSVNGRWAISDNFVVRGSWSEGFKAPDLIDVTQSLAESFNDLADQFRCDAMGVAVCPTFQVQNFSGGNPNLVAEKSESLGFGAIANLGDLSVSVDYYDVKIKDQVTSATLARINALEAEGNLPPGVIVNRAPTVGGIPGAIISIIRPNVNDALLETSGIDVGVNYGFDTDFGDFDINATWVHVLEYNRQANADGPVSELAGVEGAPRNRANTSVRYTRDNVTVSWNTTFIDSHEDALGDSTPEKYDTYWTHDVRLGWNDPMGFDGLTLAAGVLNLTEVDPPLDPISGWDDGISLPLYEVRGRVPYINVKYRFDGAGLPF